MPDFVRLPLAVFRLPRVANVNVYCLQEGQTKLSLYSSANIGLTEEDLQKLDSRGHKTLYVPATDFINLEKHLCASLEEIIADDTVAPEDRFAVLQTAVSVEIDVAFRMIKCDRFVSLAGRVADQITTIFGGNKTLPKKLFDIVQHDFYTFTHVTNVTGFAMLLADRLGMVSPMESRKLMVGALLHDIGKRFVPSQILCKPGRLDRKEWALIQTHPQRGYEDLLDRKDLEHGQRMMVYQHHERVDGSGYPVGILGDEIHPWAKLLSVVDVFDALTSRRLYRKPMEMSDALAYLQQNAGSQFDEEMVQCWISAIAER